MNDVQLKRVLWLLLPALGLLWWLGMQLNIMEVDAAQYASIAREMRHNQQWLQVYEHGQTYQSRGYPDKPPLLFWLGAAGMYIFGENNLGYRFFAVISSVLAVWGMGRWAALLFGERARWPARIIYSCNIGMLLLNSDLRTDTLLINLIALAGWQLEIFLRGGRYKHWFSGISLLSLAMLAKGPVALVALAAAFGADALLRRDFKRLRQPAWLAAPVLILAWLAPMLYGLYQQWGWEKGIKYYFWTQSFGRITGENVWENDLPFSFLSETLLWAFLPWSLLVPALLYFMVAKAGRYQLPGGWVGPAGFVIMLLAMSSSHYKLPHYVYVVWPFLTLALCGQLNSWEKPFWRKIVTGSALLMVLALSLGLVFMRDWPWHILLWLLFPVLAWVFISKRIQANGLWWLHAAVGFLYTGMLLQLFFYPWLLGFQASSEAGNRLRELGVASQAWTFDTRGESLHALHFYSREELPATHEISMLPAGSWVYTHADGWAQLEAAGRQPQPIDSFHYFPVTLLRPAFLNPKSRESVLEKRYILQLSR